MSAGNVTFFMAMFFLGCAVVVLAPHVGRADADLIALGCVAIATIAFFISLVLK